MTIRKNTGKTLVLVFACMCTALSGPFAADEVKEMLIDGVAANANEHVVTVGEVMALMQPESRQLRARYGGSELKTRLQGAYRKALDSLIDRLLIIDSYKKEGLQIPEWAVNRRVEEIVRDRFENDFKKLMDELSKANMTLKEWREEVLNYLIVSSMKSAKVHQDLAVSPGSVKDYYRKNIEKYSLPGQVKLRMIVLKKDASGTGGTFNRKSAGEVVKKLRKGDDFASMAKKISKGVHADNGGDWGWTDPKVLQSDLRKAAAEMDVMKVSDLIEVGDDFFVMRVEGRKAATTVSLEDAYADIEAELKRTKADALYRGWVNRLRKDAYIKIFDANVFE